ncbi:MAG: hypothetical protein EA392_15075 [Cryomorphaceae bacterium]|nr:MAG: hypothetical protein EA392_15075 [Cryomorphaceae bacterium]
MSVVVYTEKPSPRVAYAVDLLFGNLLGLTYKVTQNPDDLHQPGVFGLNYSNKQLQAHVNISPQEWMFRSDTRAISVAVGKWQGLPVLFPNDSPEVGFDWLAASFYLASRYEEYLPFSPDRHERFAASESLAYREGFLRRPLINEWALAIKVLVQTARPKISFNSKEFRAEITFDIDVGWAYRHKGWWRTTAALGREVVLFRFRAAWRRFRVLLGLEPDPYDTYDYVFQTINDSSLDARFFMLLGDFNTFDRNSHHHNKAMIKLIHRIAAVANVGIHPSYESKYSRQQLRKEVLRLRRILGAPVTESRQHYLRLNFPNTYKELINAGITDDFTMGYAQQAGFRASLCTPFQYFDLSENQVTPLKVHPFAYMDGTLNHYMKLEPESAIELADELIDSVRKVGGVFYCLWHNSSLCEEREWQGWRRVYEATLRSCQSGEHLKS